MPLGKLTLRPGIDRQSSQTAGEGGWWDANRVRFRGGWPEKFGGWRRLSSTLIEGRVRAIAGWALLTGEIIAAVGSHLKLYLYSGGAFTDVTPIDRTRTVDAGIATTSGSALVEVEFTAAHGAAEGDVFTFDTLTGVSRTAAGLTVGGASLDGDLTVNRVISTTVVEVTAGSSASSTVAAGGGGPHTATFFLPSGRPDMTQGQGYGAGTYSRGGYGTPADVSAVTLGARFWSLDAWGEVLLGAPGEERLYRWVPGTGGAVDSRAEVVVASTASEGPPLRVRGMIVAMPQRQVILWGCSALNSSSGYDPMLLRWSDIEDYTMFLAAADNAAGSIRLQGGTEIRAGFNTQMQTLIWTDTTLYGLRFIGQPLIYRADVLGRSCGIIGPKAFAEVNGAIYWMGPGGFFVFRGGAPEPLPCTMWDDVFGDLNREQQAKVVCAGNSLFGEVLFFYPTADSSEPNRYVAYNTVERVWYGGILTRTAWMDRDVFPQPIATCWNTRILYAHEVGTDADTNPLGEWIESGWVDIEDGEWMSFVERLIPDWRRLSGSVRLTVRAVDYPGRAPRESGPHEVTSETGDVVVRLRGRQMSLRIDGDAVAGGDWRLGALRARLQRDGRVY
jgi:hypothetical protein